MHHAKANAPAKMNWCNTKADIVKLSYTWQIGDFSFLEGEVGEELLSPQFSAGSDATIRWQLSLYPRGVDEESKRYLSVCLKLVDCIYEQVRAKFKFSVLDANGEVGGFFDSGQPEPFVPGFPRGCFKLFRRSLLFQKAEALLPNDKLTLHCELEVIGNLLNVSGQARTDLVNVPECKLSEDLGAIINNQKFSDLILSVGGRELYAHKFILAARCPNFLMKHGTTGHDTENRLEITDVSYDVLHEVLRFIYTGTAPKIEALAEELLAAANRYALIRLKAMCEEALRRSLSAGNAAKILVLADAHRASQLKDLVVDFISTHAVRVCETATWKAMVTEHPTLAAEVYRALAARQASTSQESN